MLILKPRPGTNYCFQISEQSDFLDGHVELMCELRFDDGDASGKPTYLKLSMQPGNGEWCLDSVMPITITYVK
jgi:hypothetical protein